MWNRELNTAFTNKLVSFCQGKRVIVVGNSLSLFAKPYGEFIDSFDIVVRLGKGYPWPEFAENMGTKTDVWMASLLRTTNYKEFKDVPFKILNITQMSLYDLKKQTSSIPKILYNEDFQIYKDYFLMGNADQTLGLIKRSYGKVDMLERASQGVLTLSYFTNRVRSHKELHVIGFDFFESRIQYEMDGHINEVSSYHMPVPVYKGTNTNPHAGLGSGKNLDREYIQKLKNENKIIFHEMEPLVNTPETSKKMQLIMEKYRKKGTIVSIGTLVETSDTKNVETTVEETTI